MSIFGGYPYPTYGRHEPVPAGLGRPCCDHCNNLEGDPAGHDYGDRSAHDGPCAECAMADPWDAVP